MAARKMPASYEKLLMKHVGRNMRRLRSEQGMTMRDVAEMSGFGESTIGAWEIGSTTISLARLIWLCRHMGWRLSEMLGKNMSEEALKNEVDPRGDAEGAQV